MHLSEIEWTDTTWNPVAGCTAASSGCTNCYAMHMALRLEAMGMEKYQGLARRSGKRTVWTGAINLDEESLAAPLQWRKPRKIFVNSMSDLFHEKVPFTFVKRVWQTMEKTPHHQYQILTKRPERMLDFVRNHVDVVLPNVWLGTSVEGKETVARIDIISATPAVIRFVSFEPLIAPVGEVDLSNIHWAIVGGESGPQARPIKEHWIEEIHSLCVRHGTAFFFKQWGTWGKDNKKRSKKANGRLFRGKIWEEMPITSVSP
ncbi:phage Gp37/Gp68 family protein [Tepidamorphus sp. 3E244]|uniref:phage Gp37/Gp68 family protein n=1 Tax=Tepidamorphus sp. 3E244 TaxID=3385498 RepID=UPI0038FCABB4